MEKEQNYLMRIQDWLEKVNRRYGDVGSIVSVIFWLIVLVLALRSMLFFH